MINHPVVTFLLPDSPIRVIQRKDQPIPEGATKIQEEDGIFMQEQETEKQNEGTN